MNRLPFLSLVLLTLLALASCRTEPKEATVNFKRTSDTVVVRQEVEPDRINPILSTSSYSRAVFERVGSLLEEIDPYTLDYMPLLITDEPEMTAVQDGPYAGGVAYDMEIRPEAVWDNGTPVTGQDVAFTYKAALNPLVQAPVYRAYVSVIKDVQIDESNPKKFRVIAFPQNIISRGIITNTITILPKYKYDAEGLLDDYTIAELGDRANDERLKTEEDLIAFAEYFNAPETSTSPDRIAGCGPYKLVEWQQGERLILDKKDDWWGDALTKTNPQLAAHPEAIVYVPIESPATAMQALRAEEVDVMRSIPANEFVELKDDPFVAERYNLYTPPSMTYYFISVNSTDPLLADKKVRQAIAHTVNVQEVIDNLYAGMGDRIASPVYKEFEYYNNELQPVPFDIERARKLLSEAGWEDTNDNGIVDKELEGERRELSLEYNFTASSETSRNIALLLQDNAAQAGIEIQPNGVEPREGFRLMNALDYQLASAGSTSTLDWYPKQSWHTQGNNRTGFGNAETDALIDEITTTLDTKKRYEMYRELQEIIYDEMVNIFLFIPRERMAVHKRFEMEPFELAPGFNPQYFDLKESLQ